MRKIESATSLESPNVDARLRDEIVIVPGENSVTRLPIKEF